jgi:hypothetical protein
VVAVAVAVVVVVVVAMIFESLHSVGGFASPVLLLLL